MATNAASYRRFRIYCANFAQMDRNERRIWSVNEYRSEIYGHTKQNNLKSKSELMTASGPLHQATAHQPTQPSSSREKEKANRKLSLRWLLIVPFVLQIFAAVGLTGYLSFRNGQQAINELATRLRSEVSLRIDQHLETQLDTARNLAQTNGDAIDLKLLDPSYPGALGQFFWKQLKLHNIGYIGFAYTTILRVLGVSLKMVGSRWMKFLGSATAT